MKNKYRVYFSGRDFKGEGIYNYEDGSLIIEKGSTIAEETYSLREHYGNVALIKDELIEKEIIIDRVFVEDYRFTKPYHGSVILSSYGKSGNKAWKTVDGKTIEDILTIRENVQVFKEYINNYELKEDPKKDRARSPESYRRFSRAISPR